MSNNVPKDDGLTWYILLLMVCVSILTFYKLVTANIPVVKHELYPKISREDMLYGAQNGDVVFFSGITEGERNMKVASYSPWTHIGILFREVDDDTNCDIVYIFECDLGQHSTDGIRIMPLAKKLDYWHANVDYGDRPKYMAWQRLLVDNTANPKAQRPETTEIMEWLNYYLAKEEKMDLKMVTWMVSWNRPLLFFFKQLFPKMRFCSDLIASLLKKLHILKKGRPSVSYSPHDWMTNSLDLHPGYRYSSTQLIPLPSK